MEDESVCSVQNRGVQVRHLPVVERRTRNRFPRQQAVLRESRQLKLNLNGEVQRPRLCRNYLSQVGKMGEDLLNHPTKSRQ